MVIIVLPTVNCRMRNIWTRSQPVDRSVSTTHPPSMCHLQLIHRVLFCGITGSDNGSTFLSSASLQTIGSFLLFLMLSPSLSSSFSCRLRRIMQHILQMKAFDSIILLFIALNCLTMIMERPSIGQISLVDHTLESIDSSQSYLFI